MPRRTVSPVLVSRSVARSASGARLALSTVRRVLTLVCPGGLADLLGSAPGDAGQVAVDGKTACGSRTDTDDAVHLLLALTGCGRLISQLPVSDKTTEVTALPALLTPFDLTDCTVTAHALHTTRAQARYLLEEKNAHFVLVVKRNQPRLHTALHALPWKECTAAVRYDREQGVLSECGECAGEDHAVGELEEAVVDVLAHLPAGA
jgi:hypothetical protein